MNFTAKGKGSSKVVLRLSSIRREGRAYMTTVGAGAYLVDPETGCCEGIEGCVGYTLLLAPNSLRRLRRELKS
jgi:hypothetical protein